MVVEQMGCLGGIGTAGLHPQMQMIMYEKGLVNGIPLEISKRAEKRGIGLRGYRYGKHVIQYEVEGMKRLLDDMVLESGCEILYHTMVVDAIMEDSTITGVIIENKSGRSAILAKRVVDCTADADVAARAGAEFEYGREYDGQVQPCTLMFRVDGVDIGKLNSFWNNNDKNINDIWQKAIQAGDMEPFQTKLMGFWVTHARPNQIAVNFTNLTGINPTKAEDLTKVMIIGRKQAEQTCKVMKKYIPGCENIYIVDTAALPGMRESRRIKGEYTLTVEDILSVRKFEERIAKGCFYIDIHNPVDTGMSEVYKPRHLPPGEHYDIPYGCIVPLKIENLLVAGRCISVTHEALGSTRVMMQCVELGEGAGSAAAFSIRGNVAPRKLDIPKLREVMKRNCVYFDQHL